MWKPLDVVSVAWNRMIPWSGSSREHLKPIKNVSRHDAERMGWKSMVWTILRRRWLSIPKRYPNSAETWPWTSQRFQVTSKWYFSPKWYQTSWNRIQIHYDVTESTLDGPKDPNSQCNPSPYPSQRTIIQQAIQRVGQQVKQPTASKRAGDRGEALNITQ